MSEDDEVGYCRPPKASQFKKGQSGNPGGRPKQTRNLKTDLKDELAKEISVNDNGKQIVVSKQRAMVIGLLAKAAKGDPRASNVIFKFVMQLFTEDIEDEIDNQLSISDRKLLKNYILRLCKSTDEEG